MQMALWCKNVYLAKRIALWADFYNEVYLKNLKGVAFGDLEGTGEWFFSTENVVTYVTYNWNIFHQQTVDEFFLFFIEAVVCLQ